MPAREPNPVPKRVKEILLAYNADWSLSGGLRHLIDAAKGTADCALCQITHGVIRERDAERLYSAAWRIGAAPQRTWLAGDEAARVEELVRRGVLVAPRRKATKAWIRSLATRIPEVGANVVAAVLDEREHGR